VWTYRLVSRDDQDHPEGKEKGVTPELMVTMAYLDLQGPQDPRDRLRNF
jgi:hypothetical protein